MAIMVRKSVNLRSEYENARTRKEGLLEHYDNVSQLPIEPLSFDGFSLCDVDLGFHTPIFRDLQGLQEHVDSLQDSHVPYSAGLYAMRFGQDETFVTIVVFKKIVA